MILLEHYYYYYDYCYYYYYYYSVAILAQAIWLKLFTVWV